MMAMRSASRSVNCRTIEGMVSSPASRAARNRRSPATIWNAPPEGRRRTGWSTPRSRIESASSLMVAGSNCVRGWAGFLTIFVRDTCWMSPCRGSGAAPPGIAEGGAIGTSRSTAVGIRASSPRPNAFLTTFDHLPRHIDVARRSGAYRTVDDHRLPEARRFAQPYVARDHGSIDPLRKEATRILEALLREVEAIVIHGQENALD